MPGSEENLGGNAPPTTVEHFSLIDEIIGPTLVFIPMSAVLSGASGVIGKWAYSFFNPSIAGTLGNFATFVAIGAIAAPIIAIPALITDHLLNNSPFWQKHPSLRRFFESSLGLIYAAAAVAASAAIIGNPIIPTMVAVLLLPAILWALINIGNISRALCDCSNNDTPLLRACQ